MVLKLRNMNNPHPLRYHNDSAGDFVCSRTLLHILQAQRLLQCILADSFNGTIIYESIRYNVKMLIAHCEDSVIYDSLDKKYDVDMEVFKKKLSSLHCANVDALYARIEDFWNKDIDIEDWAKF